MRNPIQKRIRNTKRVLDDMSGKEEVKPLIPDKRGLQKKKRNCQERYDKEKVKVCANSLLERPHPQSLTSTQNILS